MYYEIKTERLVLRPLDISDIETTHAYASDAENTVFMLFLPNDTIAETEAFLSRATSEWKKDAPSFFEFAVTLDGVHIGAVSAYLSDDRETAELGWMLDKKYHGNGYMTEAARAVKDFAIDVLHVKKIIAQCDSRNIPSYRVMEKIGLKRVSDDGVRFYPRRNETARELTYALVVR